MASTRRVDLEAVESIGHVLGVAAVIVGIAGVGLSISLAGDFSLRAANLSELGDPSADRAWLFNGTLVLSGVLSTGFFLALVGRFEERFQRLGVIIFAVSGMSLVGVGVFPTGHLLHLPFSAVFFAGVTLGLLIMGYGDRHAGRERRATIAWNLALLHVIAWAFAIIALEGVALAELVGAACYAIWVLIAVIQRGRFLSTAHL